MTQAEIGHAVLTFLEGVPPRVVGKLQTWEGHRLTQSPGALRALVKAGKLVFVDGGYRLPDNHPHLAAPAALSAELL